MVGLTYLRGRFSPWALACVLLSTLSLLLSSRMALLFGMMFVPWFFLASPVRGKLRLSLLLGAVGLVGVVAWVKFGAAVNRDTINVMFELVINFADDGTLRTQSTTALFATYGYFPAKVSTFLLGNGLYMKTDSLQTVDAGPQIILFGAGVFAVMGYFGLFFVYARAALRSAKHTRWRQAVTAMVFFLIVANLKADALFARVSGDAFLLLAVLGFLELRRSSVKGPVGDCENLLC